MSSIMNETNADVINSQLDTAQDQVNTISESGKDTRCHFRVAPSWGTLTKDSIIMMDNKLKVLLAVTFNSIDKFVRDNGQDNLTWDKLVQIMEQNVMIERKSAKDLNVIQSTEKSDTHWFKTDGSADKNIRDGVIRWIRENIQDPDLLAVIGDDAMAKIANIYAESGSSVDNFWHFFANYDDDDFTILDVGIIRTPDITKPTIQLFRIKLHVRRHDQRVLFIQSDTSSLNLEANTQTYVPREEIMSQIKEQVLQKAVEDMNKMFDDLFK